MRDRRESGGQASLEYILLLFTAVMAFMVIFNTFLKPGLSKLTKYASGTLDAALTKGNLHTLPFKSQ